MADVNADGYLDIYVSRNGYSTEKTDRRNLLYINNQDLTFTESAIQYGLADVGFSTQAVFFDMDNDGDLDMYQVNQLADKKLLLQNKIPKSQFKTVFDPGFTTKTRGWGLGLSLSKRIIEDYHKGKIKVLKSVIGEGTTFQISLRQF